MDLTPKPSTPWWSLFNCCRAPAASSTSKNEKEQDHHEYINEDTATAYDSSSMTPKSSSGRKAGGNEEVGTPATACMDYSVDASFDSQDEGFIAKTLAYEKDASIGDSMADDSTMRSSSSKSLSHVGHDDEMSSEDTIYSQYDIVPEIEEAPTKVKAANCWNEMNNSTKDCLETKFLHFMFLMLLRHMFGSWLTGTLDPVTSIFNRKLMLTEYGNDDKKGSNKVEPVGLQCDEGRGDAVPELEGEESSIGDIAAIDE
mmetsp:Transcript_11663/g.24888  ORF Transcript_11663/g.24888 Transcript_11663/m.24888 type:complete len:257 (-) Transcript_11663:129-899(-)